MTLMLKKLMRRKEGHNIPKVEVITGAIFFARDKVSLKEMVTQANDYKTIKMRKLKEESL